MSRTCMLASILAIVDRRIGETEAAATEAFARKAWGRYAAGKIAADELRRLRVEVVKTVGSLRECQNRA